MKLANRKSKFVEQYNDSVSAFKHDFDNIITTIGGYIKTNDMEGLKKYYSELEKDCQKVNTLRVLGSDIVKNNGIRNLLIKKYDVADSKDVKIDFTFLMDVSKINMKSYQFSRILGILLDNAIEASSECDKKIVNLIFREDTVYRRQLVTIENTYNDKNVDTKKIFNKGVSGKSNHTGLGLWEVNKLVSKNSNVKLLTSKNGDFFVQQLEIYY